MSTKSTILIFNEDDEGTHCTFVSHRNVFEITSYQMDRSEANALVALRHVEEMGLLDSKPGFGEGTMSIQSVKGHDDGDDKPH